MGFSPFPCHVRLRIVLPASVPSLRLSRVSGPLSGPAPGLALVQPPWQNGAAPSAYSSSTAVTVPVMSSSSPFMAFSSNPSPLTLMSSFPPLTMISSRP